MIEQETIKNVIITLTSQRLIINCNMVNMVRKVIISGDMKVPLVARNDHLKITAFSWISLGNQDKSD